MSKHTTEKGILASKCKSEEQTSSKILANELVKFAEFILKNIFFFNLATKLSNRSLVVLLGLNLLLHTPAFIWNKLRQIFLKRRSFNHLYGWNISTKSFLFGNMEKQNWKGLWRDLITFCRMFNLHVSHRKKELHF